MSGFSNIPPATATRVPENAPKGLRVAHEMFSIVHISQHDHFQENWANVAGALYPVLHDGAKGRSQCESNAERSNYEQNLQHTTGLVREGA